MIEGSIMRVPHTGKRKHPGSDMIEIDTRGILFICGGAFVGLDRIIEKRTNNRSVGFHSAVVNTQIQENTYQQVTTKDLIQYGLIPEFVGRFGLITSVDELSTDDLVKVLKEPKNSFVRQYQYIFHLDGIDLVFDDEALVTIAKKAKDLKTNARGLKNIIEKCLLPYQFDAMDLVERGLVKIAITKETIEGSAAQMVFDNTAMSASGK
jgi:ATP-dependent Clp protease ATP-binding subunit ClpX